MFSLKARADRLRKVLELIKADACIVKSEESRRYLTGISTSEGVVVITRAGNRYFLIDQRYEEFAARQLQPRAVSQA